MDTVDIDQILQELNKINDQTTPACSISKDDGVVCENCNIDMVMQEQYYLCEKCGNIGEFISKQITLTDCKTNYNSNKSGKGSYMSNGRHNNNSTDHKLVSMKKLLQSMRSINENSTHMRLPEYVLSFALKIYESFKADRVSRCNKKKGIIANCMLLACNHFSIPRTPKEIATILGINETVITNNQPIVADHVKTHNLFVDATNDNDYMFMLRFCETLHIKKIYITFALALLKREEKKKLVIIHNSKLNTRCAGVIYFLLGIYGSKELQEDLPDLNPITQDSIHQATAVAPTTYKKTTQIFEQYYNKFKKTFKQYQMRMPKKWKKKGDSNTPTTS